MKEIQQDSLDKFAENFSRQLLKKNRFLERNLKVVCKSLKKEVQRTKIIAPSTLWNADEGLFLGIKDSFSTPLPEKLFRYMPSEYAIQSIKENTLHFSSASCFPEDDTKLDDLSAVNKKMFSDSRCKSFLKHVKNNAAVSDQNRNTVSKNLTDYRNYYETLRGFTRVCCCTDTCRSHHHWEEYGNHWSGVCLCFLSKDLHRSVNKITYEPRTKFDVCEQLAKLFHLSADAAKMLDTKIPTKNEVMRYSNNMKGQVIERLFSRSATYKGKRIQDDREWRYITYGKVSEWDDFGKEHFYDRLWGEFQFVVLGPFINPLHKDEILDLCREKGIPVIEMNFDCSVKSCDSDAISSEFYTYLH